MTHMRLPTYYLSHGGGPWPWMQAQNGSTFDLLEASLVQVRREVGEPRAVLMVSGHWEFDHFVTSSAVRPPMVFDYHGYPEDMYHIRYDAPGLPALADRVCAILQEGGIAAGTDAVRGLDHGTFSLMKPMYPDADMPVVQLSLRADYDPAAHLLAGRLLAPLRDDGVLIIGSGSSYHNLAKWARPAASDSRLFDNWLDETSCKVSPEERAKRLLRWSDAPGARASHPQEDHLMPLHVVVGAAGEDVGTRIYHEDDFMGVAVSSFRFGMSVVR